MILYRAAKRAASGRKIGMPETVRAGGAEAEKWLLEWLAGEGAETPGAASGGESAPQPAQ
jgi:hypothetical protein